MAYDDYFTSWTPQEDEPIKVSRPPLLWLLAGLTFAIGGGILGWLSPKLLLAALGWLMSGPVAFGVLAYFQNRDLKARASGLYAEPGWLKPAYIASLAVALVAVFATAWRLADYIGRMS